MKQIHLIIIKIFSYAFVAILCLASYSSQINAHEFVFGAIIIRHPVIRVVEETGRKAEGYVEIYNNGRKNVKLIGATLEGARKSELFQIQKENGTLKKNMIEEGIEIKAGQSLHLAPKKDFIIFDEIFKDYDEDTYINGSLIFSTTGPVKIEYLVAQSKDKVQKNTIRIN